MYTAGYNWQYRRSVLKFDEGLFYKNNIEAWSTIS